MDQAQRAPQRLAGLRERVASLPLRWQIGSLVVLGLLAIFVLFGALGHAIAEDAKQRTVSEWANIAASTASVIDSEIDLEYRRLEEVAALLGGASQDPAGQRRILDATLGELGPLAGHTVLLSPDRSVTWPTTGAAEARAVVLDPQALDPLRTGQRYASGVRNLADTAVVILAVPVTTEGRATGVLAVVMSPATGVIEDLVASARGLARTGHAELVDQNDRVIASTDRADLLGPGEHPDFYDPHLFHRSSGTGLTDPVGVQDPIDQGQRHDMAFISLKTVPWGFALGGSDAELSADAARWENQTIVLGAITLVLALLLVWLTTRSVARPVLALAAASRQIAGGDLETRVPLGGEGEVRVLAQAFDHMREKLRSALSELAVEKSRYEGIVTSMADAVVTTDIGGRITALNPAAAALTGWALEDALGHPVSEVIPPARAAASAPVVDPAAVRMTLHRRDGTDAIVAMTQSPISDRDGVLAGTVHVLRDISAEAEVERMKEEFLATVSHELRTPLGFIMGYSTTLLLPDAPDDPATTRRCIQVIAEASDELKHLVDDLLDMTRIGSGTFNITPAPVAIGPLVETVVDRSRARRSGHRFVVDVPTGIPLVRADAQRVEQVLYNLLDNAIKYSPDGGVVTVRAEESHANVVVSVLDEGFGVRPDELSSIFDRFYRGRVARTRGIAGTGLGLAICKGIVEAHGGRIWAESSVAGGRGTAIRFTLGVVARETAPSEKTLASAGATQ